MTSIGAPLSSKAVRFVDDVLGSGAQVSLLTGDASFRRYFRVMLPDGQRYVLMDAPPDKEDSAPFVDIGRFLDRHGVRVPRIHALRLDQGHLLLEDLGDITYLQALQDGVRPEPLYDQAVETLLTLQDTPRNGTCIAHSRHFDRALLRFELSLFTDWYLEGIRQAAITPEDRDAFDVALHRLLDPILAQPQVLVHRDYHSRNLMWHAERIGVLDFQDALIGPITYDLASLLRDCYVAWAAPFRQRVMEQWLAGARSRLGYDPAWSDFACAFDWMALQRNLKAIGIFGRLALRDHKSGYLKDIPRTLGYVQETLARYPELATLRTLIERYAPSQAKDDT
jgi:hypothetical protein